MARRAWMIGDSATADIGGARRVMIDCVWLHRGRHWTEDGHRPSSIAGECVEAIAHTVRQSVPLDQHKV
ncbi:HAD hydrolase-like protein [Mycobacterium sp. AMU20-3851]|uniref:HAD hydrolase-like protein n=1 Tax=Mycobacterium sp. AMU20-3851 TaxID=3122055 RepID=UPI00375523A2